MFLAVNLAAAIVWGCVFSAIGYAFGNVIEEMLGRIDTGRLILLGAAALLLVGGGWFTLAEMAGAQRYDLHDDDHRGRGGYRRAGHVNNAVWVQWIQRIATAHWEAVAPAEHKAAYVWVVTRHEIDYRGSVVAGETVTGETGRGRAEGRAVRPACAVRRRLTGA